MKKCILTFILLNFFFSLNSCKQAAKTNPFGDLTQLEGEWKMSGSENPESDFLLESWTKVNDTLYSGKAYEVIQNDSTLTETIQLVVTNDEVFYIPTVVNQNNQQPVTFKLTKTEGKKFIFENHGHDFPNTIVYELKGDQELEASISGTIKGELRSMEFYYKKVVK